ncbi:MAG: hypothetical protein M5U07_24325 [Xanthobacteraceae bacterium]|nr:hypothetical protein [Xanthobacteraceae bacterium]PWB58383.1 MAG: hypothetical protein C3F17_18775 [Bradyrhizobiaceae bacterium]
MFARSAVALLSLLAAAASAAAEPMNAQQARAFVAGKLFSFSCFDGTAGSGRIYNDGSAAGVVKFLGRSGQRFMALPPGTLRVKGDAICASVKGLFFEPCFNLQRTSAYSFRGSVSGMGFAYCDFTRRGGRTFVARANARPLAIGPRTTGSVPDTPTADSVAPGEMRGSTTP